MSLVPDQIYKELCNCPFYWGKINRDEAEEILKDKPIGSFLLKNIDEEGKKCQLEIPIGSILLINKEKECQLEICCKNYNSSICFYKLHFYKDLRNNLIMVAYTKSSCSAGIISRPNITEYLLSNFCKDGFNWKYPIQRAFSLQELARAQIRKTSITQDGIRQLEIPEELKKFLLYQ